MKHGIVTSKRVDNNGHVFLTIQSSRAGVTYPNVSVNRSQPGEFQNIEEGYHVTFEECDDGLVVCMGVLETDPDLAPNTLDGSERVLRFDDGTEISATKDGSGGYDVTIKSSGKTTVEADGDVTINASGNSVLNALGDITIGEAANAVKLAVQNHTHDYTWSDPAGSGTTDPPNEAGTETVVE